MENPSCGILRFFKRSVVSHGILRKKRSIRTIPQYRSARDGLMRVYPYYRDSCNWINSPYSLSVCPDPDSTDNTNKSTSLLFLIRVYPFLLYSERQINVPDDTVRAAAENTCYFPRVYPYHFYIKNSLKGSQGSYSH